MTAFFFTFFFVPDVDKRYANIITCGLWLSTFAILYYFFVCSVVDYCDNAIVSLFGSYIVS